MTKGQQYLSNSLIKIALRLQKKNLFEVELRKIIPLE